jgi:hypothetical protein
MSFPRCLLQAGRRKVSGPTMFAEAKENSASISAAYRKRRLRVRVLSAQPCSKAHRRCPVLPGSRGSANSQAPRKTKRPRAPLRGSMTKPMLWSRGDRQAFNSHDGSTTRLLADRFDLRGHRRADIHCRSSTYAIDDRLVRSAV